MLVHIQLLPQFFNQTLLILDKRILILQDILSIQILLIYSRFVVLKKLELCAHLLQLHLQVVPLFFVMHLHV